MPNCPGQVSRQVLYPFFSSRPSWHWHWLHGALLVSRVIYVPADTRWRWLKPFRLLQQPPSLLLAPPLARLLACPFGVSPYFLIRSYPWAALFAQAQPKQIDFQRNATYAVTSCSPPPSPLHPAPRSLSGLLGNKCTVSVKGLSLISGQRQNSTGLRITLNRNLSLFITN